MARLNQRGSLHLGLLLALVVFGAVIFTGFRVVSSRQSTSTVSTASDSNEPTAIKTKADLTQTGKVLDQTDAQLDASLNDASLDSDINSML